MKTTVIGFTFFILTGLQNPKANDTLLQAAVYTIKSEVLPDEFTETLTDHIESKLLDYPGYRVISRSNLDVLITEDHLSQSGITGDEVQLLGSGARSSVDKICTGSISRIGRSYSFTLKMIDVGSARIDAAAQKIYSGPVEGLLDIGSGLLSEIIPADSSSENNQLMSTPELTPEDTIVYLLQPLQRKEAIQQSTPVVRQDPVVSEHHRKSAPARPVDAPVQKKLSALGRNISIGAVMIFGTLAALLIVTRNQ